MTDSIRLKDIFVVGGEEPCNTHGGQDDSSFNVQRSSSDCAIVCGANGQL